ncbi:UDP-galactopyranose mutase [Wenyingzhuangia heitensis]|uniref:UDP-galactopyranose mutase n=1 Tax=Wenyingzhuangia heitensis TaxID=1487859 RepID=A0ABX0UAW5_9FLAO|nr:UDP-galactopyranose mutase [Wenyingzhuangia heitensis]NIJ45423.1 UDP-galactopyranose mutase [Wenyingzhuangia heitensis]
MDCKRYLVVGAGFSGAVIARKLAEQGCKVVVVDKRNHIAGNCHTERENKTNVMVHKYGPHIFNTNNKRVWDYVNTFGSFMSYKNKVIADTEKGVFSMPMNLLTINQFFYTKLTPNTVEAYLKTKQLKIQNPQNFEEQALAFLGEDLYYNFFYGYTKKQWGCEPKELPSSILKRLPIRFNYDDNYYNSKYQGIPEKGYTGIISNILDHENIEVRLDTEYSSTENSNYEHVFYTGAIDAYHNYKYGRLGYRTVFFKEEIHNGDYQGNAVINYCDQDVEHTRVHEHKHFAPWEKHDKTIVITEYSKETTKEDEPYYPKRLEQDIKMFEDYKLYTNGLKENVSFVGRLATYRYLDMDKVIEEAISYVEYFINNKKTNRPFGGDLFSNLD